MKLTAAGAAFVEDFEGFYPRPYNDAEVPSSPLFYKPGGAGNATIGIGTLLHMGTVTPGDIKKWGTITRARAVGLMISETEEIAAAVARLVKVPVNENEANAILSLVFNIGIGGFEGSTVLRELNRGHREAAADAFLMWNKVDGVVWAGLDRRRRAERKLFLRPVAVQVDPLVGLSANERRWCVEYDRLYKAKSNLARRRELRALMTRQRKAIWHAAKDHGGWDIRHRQERYAALKRRSA